MIFWRFDDDVEIIIWKTDESVDETLLFFAPEIQEMHREKLESSNTRSVVRSTCALVCL